MLLSHMPQVLGCEAEGQMLSTTQEEGIQKSTTPWHVILFIIMEIFLFLPTISSGMIRIFVRYQGRYNSLELSNDL